MLRAIDLFAGAGGLSLGFLWGGFEVIAAVEGNQHAAKTYRANHADVLCLEQRIEDIEPHDLRNRLGLQQGELTAVVGGPPCQGFSYSNRRTRTLDNPVNYLYQDYFAFVEEFRPDWFVLENVAGIRTIGGGEVLTNIISVGRTLGYAVSVGEMSAEMYGVPQRRRRVFVVGGPSTASDFALPAPTCDGSDVPFVTVRDAVADLPSLPVGADIDTRPYRTSRNLSSYQVTMRGLCHEGAVSGNLVTNNNDLVLERYKHIGPGENWSALPPRLMKNYADAKRCHTGIYHRLQWDQPAKVLGNFRKNMLIHPDEDRGLSVREAARLQSFPDWYRFCGTIGLQQQQVGNAVPPLLAQAVARSIAEHVSEPSEG